MSRTSKAEMVEDVALVVILLTVGGFAGAASFTHVHDWTMAHTPAGRGDWFGWANAVISELVPIACLRVMRRRRRKGQGIAYPACLLVAALALSITAQLAVSKPGLSGAIVSVVPALAFAGLAKLVLGKTREPKTRTTQPLSPPIRVEPPGPHQPIKPDGITPAVTSATAVNQIGAREVGRLTR